MQIETDNYSEDVGNYLDVDDDVNGDDDSIDGDCEDNFNDERCIDDSIQLELETVEIAFTASTLAASMIFIMTFAITHRLSSAALTDLLTLINLHCLIDIPSLQSLYRFQNYFNYKDSPLGSACYHWRVEMSLDVQIMHVCKHLIPHARHHISSKYLLLSKFKICLPERVSTMTCNIGFREEKNNLMHIEDIYDGNVYNDHMKPSGLLSSPKNISFMLNISLDK